MRELSLHMMDIVQNSISAGASLITVSVEQDASAGTLVLTVADNGRGMSPEQMESVQSPFYTTRTTRSVGLGVPLFKMACEMTGGAFEILSEQGVGTTVRAAFDANHIDMVPLGDMNQTVLLLIACNPELDFVYRKRMDGEDFTMDTRELREVLGGDVPLNHPEVTAWIKDFLEQSSQPS